MAQLVTVDDAIKAFNGYFANDAVQRQLAVALPRHLTADRFTRIVLTEIRRIPKLVTDCKRESLLGAIVQAAQLGLEPGVLGQCWILPYKDEATFIPGYRGLAQLAWRSGMVGSLCARAVFEGDDFDYDYGEETIRHKPKVDPDPDKLTHAYSILHIKGGGRIFEVMRRSEIEAIKRRSPSAGSKHSPWNTDYIPMACKTPFRKMMKLGPLSAELQRAIELDEAADRGESQGLSASDAVFTTSTTEPRPSEEDRAPDASADDAPPSAREEGSTRGCTICDGEVVPGTDRCKRHQGTNGGGAR